MSKTVDALRARGIHNDHDFFGAEPYLYYAGRDNTRAGTAISHGWGVTKRGFDLGQAWYDRGSRWFSNWGRHDKAAKREEAAAFLATLNGGDTDLARCPFGGWGRKVFVKRRLKQILALPLREAQP